MGVAVENKLQPVFALGVAPQARHPRNHTSFAANHPGKRPFEIIELGGMPQTLWPVHCVQGTPGAALSRSLHQEHIRKIFHKGTDPEIDSYSGMFDNWHRKSTGLGEWLKAEGITEVFLCGLATDYCVKFTALDAVKFGFKVRVIEDASRGINLEPSDVKNAIGEMERAGVLILQSADILA